MTQRGYGTTLHREGPKGCICPEEFDHDGKCQNSLESSKHAKCKPCSSGWHFAKSCNRYVTKDYKTVSTQCDRCGWDSSEHPLTEGMKAIQLDARTRYARDT